MENGGGMERTSLFFNLTPLSLVFFKKKLSLMLLIYCADSVAVVRCCNGRSRGVWQTAALTVCVCAKEKI